MGVLLQLQVYGLLNGYSFIFCDFGSIWVEFYQGLVVIGVNAGGPITGMLGPNGISESTQLYFWKTYWLVLVLLLSYFVWGSAFESFTRSQLESDA